MGRHSSAPGRGQRAFAVVAGVVLVAVVATVALTNDWGSATEPAATGDGTTANVGNTAVAATPTTTSTSAPTSSASAVPPHPGTGSVPAPASTAAGTAPRGLQPVRIAIPAIHVDASMTDLGIAADGTIEVPSKPAQAGWLDTTPAPGQQGPAVVAGHVDSTTGPAVFYLLSSLKAGDEIVVTLRNASTVRFTVDGVRTYQQDAFPTSEVYGPVPGPALRLVTCGGDYVKADGGYQANVVVYAS